MNTKPIHRNYYSTTTKKLFLLFSSEYPTDNFQLKNRNRKKREQRRRNAEDHGGGGDCKIGRSRLSGPIDGKQRGWKVEKIEGYEKEYRVKGRREGNIRWWWRWSEVENDGDLVVVGQLGNMIS